MVTITNSGNDIVVSFDKQTLKTLPQVINHPTFSNEANWGKISIVLKHTESSKRLIASFTPNFTQPDYITPKFGAKKGETYEVHKIVMSSPSRATILSIKKTDIPNISSANTTLQQDAPISFPSYPRPILSSDSVDYVTGQFKLYINFNIEVNGFSAEDITVTNGVVQQLYSTGNALLYEADILPTFPGMVTVQVLGGVVSTSSDINNVSSNALSIEYTTNTGLSNDGYRYYIFSAKNGWLDNAEIAKIGINSIKFIWDDSVQKLNDSSLTYLKQPTYSDKNLFDDTIDLSKSIYWNLSAGVYNNLFKIDLGQKRDVTSVLIRPQSVNPYYPKNFKIYASNDDQSWVEILSVFETVPKWSDFNNIYHKEFIIKNKQKQFLLKRSTNWTNSLSWTPNSIPNGSDQSAVISSEGNLQQNILDIDTNATINKILFKPQRDSWTLKSTTSKLLTLDGQDSKICMTGESVFNPINIEVPINLNSDLKIEAKTDAPITFSGKITANNKNINISYDNITTTNPFKFNNLNNEISGKITLDCTSSEIKNSTSSNCSLEWSNKKGIWTFYTDNNVGIVSVNKSTVLSNLVWNGPILFKNDGNKIFSIKNDQIVQYSNNFSGVISNGLHLKNCALNQSSNNLTFQPASKLFITEGTVEWNQYNALPSLAKIQLGTTDFCDSSKPITLKFPITPYGIINELIYTGPSGTAALFNDSTHLNLQLNNTVINNFTLVKSQPGQDVSKKIINITGSGSLAAFLGDGSDTKILVSSPGHEISLGTTSMLPANKSPTFRATNGGKIKVTGYEQSAFEVQNGGILEILGQTGPVTGIVGTGNTQISGNGTINGNLTLSSNCTFYPTNTQNIDDFLYAVYNRGIDDLNFKYGANVYGNFVAGAGSKIKFDFSTNEEFLLRLNELNIANFGVQTGEATRISVYGNVTLGATIECGEWLIQAGATAILMTYTGTRTGTFVNNLGSGITITYDDANKRILATKSGTVYIR